MSRARLAIGRPILACALVAALSGCLGADVAQPGELAPGSTATYAAEYRLDDLLAFREVRYHWGSLEAGRDGTGRPVPVARVEVSVDGQATSGASYAPSMGGLVSEGRWGTEFPRGQGFAHASARWSCYPGLLLNRTLGQDVIRSWLMPVLCLAPLAAPVQDKADLTYLGVPLRVERAGEVVTITHPDASAPPGQVAQLRHRLEYDGRPVPARAEAFLEAGGAERLVWRLVLTSWEGSASDVLALDAHPDLPAAAPRRPVTFQEWTRLPPEGNTQGRVLFPLAEADAAARQQDLGFAQYAAQHPDAVLMLARYRLADRLGSSGTQRAADWTLEWSTPAGDTYSLVVERQFLSALGVADHVLVAKTGRGPAAPPMAPRAPQMALEVAITLAFQEVDLRVEDSLILEYTTSSDPRVWGSDAMHTWQVGRDPGLQFYPVPPMAVFSATTGATISRTQGAAR